MSVQELKSRTPNLGRVRHMAELLFFLIFFLKLRHARTRLMVSSIEISHSCFFFFRGLDFHGQTLIPRPRHTGHTTKRLLNRISNRVTKATFRREDWGTKLGGAFLLDFFIQRNPRLLNLIEWLDSNGFQKWIPRSDWHHSIQYQRNKQTANDYTV